MLEAFYGPKQSVLYIFITDLQNQNSYYIHIADLVVGHDCNALFYTLDKERDCPLTEYVSVLVQVYRKQEKPIKI